jgi:uncharacterized oligopeptide transporter (OPT) family protein
MAIIFSAAAAYLGLKVGQVFEAAIPIALSLLDCQPLQNVRERLARMSLSNLLGQALGLLLLVQFLRFLLFTY